MTHGTRLKYLTRVARNTVTPSDLGPTVVHYSIPNIDAFGSGRTEESSSIESNKSLVEPRDILISKLNPHKPRVVETADDEWPSVASGEFVVLRDPSVDRRFLRYALVSRSSVSDLVSRMRSVTRSHQRAQPEDILNLIIPPFSRERQQRIADFLDRATERIDALVNRKRSLIELLEEKGAATVTKAVTHGLDADARIRWSPTGERPAHWRHGRLRYLAKLQTGLTLGKRYPESQSLVETPYLRVANVQAGHLDLDEIKTVAIPQGAVCRYQLQAGDVLMTEGGDIDKLGRGAIWDGQVKGCLHQNHVFAVRSDGARLDARFLVAVLASAPGRHYFETTAYRTTNLASTNTEKTMNLPIDLPPISEQQSIVRYLDRSSENLNGATRALTRQLALLAEYREALITAAVTGEIDVDTFNGDQRMEEVAG